MNEVPFEKSVLAAAHREQVMRRKTEAAIEQEMAKRPPVMHFPRTLPWLVEALKPAPVVCRSCGGEGVRHAYCPFADEIHGVQDDCQCCEGCQAECAADI